MEKDTSNPMKSDPEEVIYRLFIFLPSLNSISKFITPYFRRNFLIIFAISVLSTDFLAISFGTLSIIAVFIIVPPLILLRLICAPHIAFHRGYFHCYKRLMHPHSFRTCLVVPTICHSLL